ncbi:ribonuclease H-like protein [Apiospora arundinis]
MKDFASITPGRIRSRSVTVYFIDRDWKQWCFLLGLPPLRGRHTGGVLADEVYNILTYFGIEKQAFGYCTLDNAGNNDTAMAKLGELFHFDAEERRIRCAPHIINLVTKSIIYGSRSDDFNVLLEGLDDHITDNNELLDQALRRLPVEVSVDEDAADVDGAEAEDIDDMSDHTDTIISSAPGIITMESIDQYRRSGPGGKLHNIGVFLRRSSQLLVAFQEAQKEADPTKAPLAWIHNVETRWESDHDMFQRALDLRLGIERFFYNIEASFTAERQSDPHAERPAILDQELSRHDWLVVGNLQKILHSFRASSRQLQGLGVALIGSSTSGGFDEYFPVIEDLLDFLETAVEGSVFLEDDLNPNGFRDYHIFAGLDRATYRNARVIAGRKTGYKSFELVGLDIGCVNRHSSLSNLPQATDSGFISRRLLFSQQFRNSAVPSSEMFQAPELQQTQSTRRGRGRQSQQGGQSATVDDELEQYLKEPPCSITTYNTNALGWWRDIGQTRYPRLSTMATDFLTIPSSTADTERTFSSVGIMTAPRRGRLESHVVSMGQCVKSWSLRGVYKAEIPLHLLDRSDWQQAVCTASAGLQVLEGDGDI